LKLLAWAAILAGSSRLGSSLGILSAMRFATAVTALLIAALLSGCSSARLPRPDRTGDTALVAAMQKTCTATAPLTPINVAAGAASVTTDANADSTAVMNLQSQLVTLTPTIADGSPLVPTVTKLSELMLDVGRRYQSIAIAEQDLATVSAELSKHHTSLLAAEKARDLNDLANWPQLAVLRTTQAQGEFTKLGITTCLR
jgi:hypothetical protein